jgi:diguanylate cyclase (GGDEF)-like protein
MWGVSSLILHTNPDENPLISYGYSGTNLFLFLTILYVGHMYLKQMNRIQVLLDTFITTICFSMVIWVFIFEQNVEKANVLQSDIIAMLSLASDMLILAFLSIWFFSMREKKASRFLNLTIVGVFIFVITDLIYYYQYFYLTYIPNSILDGAYVWSFSFLALGAGLKQYDHLDMQVYVRRENWTKRVKKELLYIIIPVVFFIFHPDETHYLIMMLVSIMLYYVFSTYIKANIYRDDLLKQEKEHNLDLELKINERTKEIVRIMNTDVITGLYNRRYLEEFLHELCEAQKNNEQILLLYIDQNKYRSIKAMFGRQISEELLKKVSDRILTVVEHGGLLASYGDDVFVLVLHGEITYDNGMIIATNIIQNCSDVYHIEGHDIIVTMNIGIASFPTDSKHSEQLIKNADTAMMQARRIGFNHALRYDEKLGDYIDHKNKIELQLKKVKFDEEFQMYYQPQINCSDGSLIGFEALIRWITKQGVFIPPSDFIPITEETGLIIPLGYWIMDKTIAQLAEWKKSSTKKIKVAINVSVKQLNDREFLPRLESILKNYEVSPSQVEIEITENIEMEENIEILETLRKIYALGVSIAVDDFGTGYSSLNYLKKLPINRIKIAKELVDNIEKDSIDFSLINMVISIGKSRGIKVIAEGVETEEQWKCLNDIECDEIQGYYFAKPMPAKAIEEQWLA